MRFFACALLWLCRLGPAHGADVASVPELFDTSGFVVAGRRFSFFVKPQEGTVQAMGSNGFGQLGIGSNQHLSRPVPVDQIPERPDGNESWVVAAAAGAFHSLFLTLDGIVYASGRNRFGQFGDGSTTSSIRPVRVCEGVKAVAAGYGHSLFLMENGTVEAAGWNFYGQLGDGSSTSSASRVKVKAFAGSASVKSIAAGYDFSYFLTQDGDVFAVGQNMGGQLGDGSRVTKLEPVKVLIAGVSLIAAGESHGLFLKDGKVYGTGSNAHGQLGDETNTLASTPTESKFTVGVNTIAAGVDSSCGAGASTGKLFCMGNNLDGQLGLGGRGGVNYPLSVPGVFAYDVSIGDSHGLVLQADYSDVLVSGSNKNGELGDGTNEGTREFKHLGLDITTTSPPPTPSMRPTPAPMPPPTPSPNPTPTTGAPSPDRDPRIPDFIPDPWTMFYVFAGALGSAGLIFLALSRLLGQGRSETQESHMDLVRRGVRTSG